MADIVINHRCGDQQDAEGRWNVFTSTGPLVLQRSWRCRDARGARGPLVKLEVGHHAGGWEPEMLPGFLEHHRSGMGTMMHTVKRSEWTVARIPLFQA